MKRDERNDEVEEIVGSLVTMMEAFKLGEKSCMGVECPDRDIWMNG